MERIITTNSNKVVINGINLGYLPRIRNPKNGQFVAWDVAKVDKFGFNGNIPATYCHLDNTFTFRSIDTIDNAINYYKYNDFNGNRPLSNILPNGNVIIDKHYSISWRDDNSNYKLCAWDCYFKGFNKYIFELYK